MYLVIALTCYVNCILLLRNLSHKSLSSSFFFSFHFIFTPWVWICSGFLVVTGGEVIFPCQKKKKKVVVSDVITRNPSHLVHAILLTAVYSKFNRTSPKVLNYVQNMARSVRSKERVNYIALNNLSAADIEPVSTGKRK